MSPRVEWQSGWTVTSLAMTCNNHFCRNIAKFGLQETCFSPKRGEQNYFVWSPLVHIYIYICIWYIYIYIIVKYIYMYMWIMFWYILLVRVGTMQKPWYCSLGGAGGLSPPEPSGWPPHPAKGWALGSSAGSVRVRSRLGPILIQRSRGIIGNHGKSRKKIP